MNIRGYTEQLVTLLKLDDSSIVEPLYEQLICLYPLVITAFKRPKIR